MADEDDLSAPGNGGKPQPASKLSLRTLILHASEAFPFHAERLGTIHGRSLSGVMETALAERLPEDDQLSDLEASRIFMGSSSGIADTSNNPVSNPLTPEQANELTDADIREFAKQYLARIAKLPVDGDSIAALAAYAREQRRRIADDLIRHGKFFRDSMRSISANSSIMQNWKGLQDSLQGSAFDLQRELQRAMGPADRASEAIRDAIAAIRDPTLASESIRAVIEAEKDRNELIKSMGGNLQKSMEDLRRQIEMPDISALENIRRQAGSPAVSALEELRQQIEGQASAAMEEIRKASERQTTDFDISPRSLSPQQFEMPRMPPMHETPIGRTAIAVEKLRESGGRVEAAMDIIVSQAGEVSKLIGEVSGTIQVEARQFQALSEVQTKKAMRYALVSLVVSAAALAITAWFSSLGYQADRAEARSQDNDSKTIIEELRQENSQLQSLIKQKQATVQVKTLPVAGLPPKATPVTPPARPTSQPQRHP